MGEIAMVYGKGMRVGIIWQNIFYRNVIGNEVVEIRWNTSDMGQITTVIAGLIKV